jgi:hypothetical protein
MRLGAKFAAFMLLLAGLIQSVAAVAHCFPEAYSRPQSAAPIQRTAVSEPDSDCEQQSTLAAVPQSNTCRDFELRSAAMTTVEAGESATPTASLANPTTEQSAPQAVTDLYSLYSAFRI